MDSGILQGGKVMVAVNVSWPKKTQKFHKYHIDSTIRNDFQERRTPMHRRQQFLTQIMGAIALVTLLGATPAVAEPRIYAGSNCQPTREVDPDTLLGRDNGERLINTRIDPIQVVVCPILRDLVRSTNGFAADVLVSVGVVSCAIESRSEDGSESIDSDFAEPDPNGGSPQELHLEVTQSVAQGYYTLSCRMANGSELRKYTITENP
jgi:hypothetical protein